MVFECILMLMHSVEKEHSFNNFMVFLFQVVMKSGGTTIQRGKHAQSRKAKQVQYRTPLRICFGPHHSQTPDRIKLKKHNYKTQLWLKSHYFLLPYYFH